MHQHSLPLICLSEKIAVTDIHFFMYTHHVRKSQQDSCGTVPHKKINEILPLHSGIIVVLSNNEN